MSQTTQSAPPTGRAPAEASNRVKLGLSNRLLARPEVGAAVAAIVIFVFFLIVAPAFRSPESFFTVLYQASTIGIVAVGVGMLQSRSHPGSRHGLSAPPAIGQCTQRFSYGRWWALAAAARSPSPVRGCRFRR